MAEEENIMSTLEKENEELRSNLAKLREELENQIQGNAVEQRTTKEKELEQCQEDLVHLTEDSPTFARECGAEPSFQIPQYPTSLAREFSVTSDSSTFSGFQFPVPNVTAANPDPTLHQDDTRPTKLVEQETQLSVDEQEAQQRLKSLEERLQALECTDKYGPLDIGELNLVNGLTIPRKFKVPNFEKFDGAECPKEHIKMYSRKMTAYADNDKLMIHCFQDSLAGSALKWYNRLNRSQVQSWKNLAKLFIGEYKYLIDLGPDRKMLREMEQNESESFKEYAQKWRNLASQVQPPLDDKELTITFFETLREPYSSRLINCATQGFAELFQGGIAVEKAIQSGRLKIDESNHSHFHEKSETDLDDEIDAIIEQEENETSSTNTRRKKSRARQKASRLNRKAKGIHPIPIPYAELLPKLIERNLVSPVYVEPMEPPYPKWYDPNSFCEYHCGLRGHSTENCSALQRAVQDLMKAGRLNLDA